MAPSIETFCVLLDRRSARRAVGTASRTVDPSVDRTFFLSAYHPVIWFSETLAAQVGVPALDPESVLVAEILRLSGRDSPNISCIWLPEKKRVLTVVRELLGEHGFRYVIVGTSRRNEDLCQQIIDIAERYGAQTEVVRP
jgi:hypothetical protein